MAHLDWLLAHLFAVVGFLLALLMGGSLLRERRSPAATLGWLVLIVLAPYLGVPLYLLLGGRKLRRRAERRRKRRHWTDAPPVNDLDRLLRSARIAPADGGSTVELLGTGEAAWRSLLELIDGARVSIHVTTYLIGDDDVAREVLAALGRRAAEGVEVRLLMDALGWFHADSAALSELERQGGRWSAFLPLYRAPLTGRTNLRLHRKLAVADGRHAILGGMNVSREYLGPEPWTDRWVDLCVEVRGAAVADLEDVFRSDWALATDEDLPRPELPERVGEHVVQVVPSGPDLKEDALHDLLVAALFGARRRAWIATPYFVPDESLLQACELAARRGVDVRLLVPQESDHRIADLVRGSYLRAVHRAGVSVHLHPRMMHAKLVVVDEDVAIVGSANLDFRSLFFNFELSLVTYSPDVVGDLAGWLEEQLEASREELPEARAARRWLEDAARLLAPVT